MLQSGDTENFEPKYRIDEEYEYYTELATNASQLWIESILRKRLKYQDDFRKSLEDGIILCELLNTLRPGCIKKINRLHSKIAGIDNLNVFLQTCSDVFSLQEKQLFQVSDLDDLSEKTIPPNQLADEQGKRIRRVLTTIYHLGKAATGLYDGSPIDLSAFAGIVTACPPPVSTAVYSEPSRAIQARQASVEDKVSCEIDAAPLTKTVSTPASSKHSRTADHSPSRISDAGSFDSSSNLSSNQGTQQKDSIPYLSSRSSQVRNGQNSHHFVKSGFSLPTGGSNLTRTAVEQMRLISKSRASSSLQPTSAGTKQTTVGTHNAAGDDDAWQSDLDMWRQRRKQSMQSTLPPEVLESVGLGDGEGVNFDQANGRQSKKKPGLLSKLRYSVEMDSEDPIVVSMDQQNETGPLSNFPSAVKEKLPTINDSLSESPSHNNSASPSRENNKVSAVIENGAATSAYTDLSLLIKQAPGNLRGFGFSIKGGRDTPQPLQIDRVVAGSAADEADVHADDEVLKINNEPVESYFRPTLNRLIQQCVKSGEIKLTIRRHKQQPPASISSDNFVKSTNSLPSKQGMNGSSVSNGQSSEITPNLGRIRKVVDSFDSSQKPSSPRGTVPAPPNIAVVRSPAQIELTPPVAEKASDDSDKWLRSQAQKQQSPALKSQQRYVPGVPQGYGQSPNSLGKDESQPNSQEDDVMPTRQTQSSANGQTLQPVGSPGLVLVRGANNQSQSSPVIDSNRQVTTINETVDSSNGKPSPYSSPYSQHSAQQPSMIPQPKSLNTSGNALHLTPQQQLPPSSKQENSNGSRGANKNGAGGVQPPRPSQSPQQLPRSVSSRELCAACQLALGAGPAMAIERLGLFYHVSCFRCTVCKISLSNGQTGVDVRVKGARLHCQNCNSNDESGLQSSQV